MHGLIRVRQFTISEGHLDAAVPISWRRSSRAASIWRSTCWTRWAWLEDVHLSASPSGIRNNQEQVRSARLSSGTRRSAPWPNSGRSGHRVHRSASTRRRSMAPSWIFRYKNVLRQGGHADHHPDRHAAGASSLVWSMSTRTARRKTALYHPPHVAGLLRAHAGAA